MSGNGKLVGLDGQPLDGELVTKDGYLENLGRRAGLSLQQREFLRKNLPTAEDPDHMSRSQRQIKALRDALQVVSIQNMQLFALLPAMADRLVANRGPATLVFGQKILVDKMKPEFWPAVTVDGDGDVHVVIPTPGVDPPMAVQPEPKGDVS